MSAVTHKQEVLPISSPIVQPSNAVTPLEMLDRAVQSGAAVETIEKLMGLQERWEKNEARKAFDAAVAEAKAEMKPVVKNRKAHNSTYADFAAIASAVDPILTKQGLSYRFRTAQGDRISVTCILSHRAGHSEETTLTGPADTSGSKNAIQAIGSTLTYLQRYTLVQMLGLAASDDDDGAAANAGEPISDEQFQALNGKLDEIEADKRAFCELFKIDGIAKLPKSRFKEAMDLIATRQRRKGGK